MAYKRKPNYHFATKTDTGIDNVPVGRIVVCEDFNGEVKSYVLKNKTSITAATTVEQAVGAANLVEDKVAIDATPTNGSNNAVTSNAVYDGLAGKQATLVSGTNIKTVNNTSVLGSGNMSVQATLVSGTNIKTINGSPVLGSGDLNVSSAFDVGKSHTSNGYQKFSNGLIIQWGRAVGQTITFPIAFPTACLSITASSKDVQAYVANYSGFHITPTASGATITGSGASEPVNSYYVAIGH